jgi:hypothetical protein
MFRYRVTEFRFIFFTKGADMAEANIYQTSFCEIHKLYLCVDLVNIIQEHDGTYLQENGGHISA